MQGHKNIVIIIIIILILIIYPYALLMSYLQWKNIYIKKKQKHANQQKK